MKVLRNILGAIWAVWGLITFAATLLAFLIPICITYAIKEPTGTEVFRRISQVWISSWLILILTPLRVKGRENFKKGTTYVVVCNHNSFIDIPVATPFIPGANKTIAKISLSKIPVFGWVYKRGSILVDRSREESRRRSFEDMKKTLAMGLHMVIYPEGTRNRTSDPLKSFHDGAFKLAVATKKDIVPVLLFNTKKILPANKTFFMRPYPIEMHFLPPVSYQNLTSKDLKEKVFNIMTEYYLSHAK